jgi:hypothetical protein
MPRHKTASARRCKQTATRMERRNITAANAANGLLSRQFANITDVLFKASQRRNTELQELQQRRMGPEPTPPTSRSVRELPVTAKPKLPQVSSSGNSRVELEKVYQSNKGMARDELTMTGSTTGPLGKHVYIMSLLSSDQLTHEQIRERCRSICAAVTCRTTSAILR